MEVPPDVGFVSITGDVRCWILKTCAPTAGILEAWAAFLFR
jgi:hypothetical protein